MQTDFFLDLDRVEEPDFPTPDDPWRWPGSTLKAFKKLGIFIRKNTRSGQLEFKWDNPDWFARYPARQSTPGGWYIVEDWFDDAIRVMISHLFYKVEWDAKNEVEKIVPIKAADTVPPTKDVELMDWAEHKAADPFRDYLESIPYKWTSSDRDYLSTFFRSAFKLHPSFEYSDAYLAAAARQIFVGLVAVTMRPGAINDKMIMLVGAEGVGKSLSVSAIVPEEWHEYWFTDSVRIDMDEKQMIEVMGGRVIGEFSELVGLKRGDVDRIKKNISTLRFRARLSYGKHTSNVSKSWVYVGTANDIEHLGILPRNTEGRRWPVIAIADDNDAGATYRYITSHREALLAQAMAEHNPAKSSTWMMDSSLHDEIKFHALHMTERASGIEEAVNSMEERIKKSIDVGDQKKQYRMVELLAMIDYFGVNEGIFEENLVPTSREMTKHKGINLEIQKELQRRGWKRIVPSNRDPLRWEPPQELT